MSEHDDYEPEHAASPTDQIAQELQLYGYRPSEDEADPRPVPEDRIIEGAVADSGRHLQRHAADRHRHERDREARRPQRADQLARPRPPG